MTVVSLSPIANDELEKFKLNLSKRNICEELIFTQVKSLF